MTTITTPAPTRTQIPRAYFAAIAAVVAAALTFGAWTLVDDGTGTVRSEPSTTTQSTDLSVAEEVAMIRAGSQVQPRPDLSVAEEVAMIRAGSQPTPVTDLSLAEELDLIRAGSQPAPVTDLSLGEELDTIRSGSQR